jgi:hypothetical protein
MAIEVVEKCFFLNLWINLKLPDVELCWLSALGGDQREEEGAL